MPIGFRQLFQDKVAAVGNEDYDEAKRLKVEVSLRPLYGPIASLYDIYGYKHLSACLIVSFLEDFFSIPFGKTCRN